MSFDRLVRVLAEAEGRRWTATPGRVVIVLMGGVFAGVLVVQAGSGGRFGFGEGLLLATVLAAVIGYDYTRWVARAPRIQRFRARPHGRGLRVVLIGVAVLAVAVVAYAVTRHPGDLADGLVAALPAMLILVLGGQVAVRLDRAAAGRRWRHLAEVAGIVAVAWAVVALARPDHFRAQPTTALLLPAAIWASLRTWRAMERSGHLLVRVGADLVLSLLLGTVLVIGLVWSADRFDLAPAEVVALRAFLQRADGFVDVPAALWVVVYLGLAALGLTLRLVPDPTVGTRWRLWVLPSVEVVRRTLTGLHIGLLVIVLIGLAAPPAVRPVLARQIRNHAVIDLQRDLDARARLTAYAQIRGHFGGPQPTGPPASRQNLAALVTTIRAVHRPEPGRDAATAAERDLARRMGRLQAATVPVDRFPVQAPAPGPAPGPAPVPAPAPVPDRPLGGAADIDRRLAEVQAGQRRADNRARLAEAAAELATIAVANALQVPSVGRHELIDVLKEYLGGLVETSPLKEVFASWTPRLAAGLRAPPVESMVVPEPTRLRLAAQVAFLKQQVESIRTGRFITRPKVVDGEAPLDTAVDLAEAGARAEGTDGECGGCRRPGEGPRPHERVRPEPRIPRIP